MKLFIILTAAVNMALGYALAVYMGHGRTPGRARWMPAGWRGSTSSGGDEPPAARPSTAKSTTAKLGTADSVIETVDDSADQSGVTSDVAAPDEATKAPPVQPSTPAERAVDKSEATTAPGVESGGTPKTQKSEPIDSLAVQSISNDTDGVEQSMPSMASAEARETNETNDKSPLGGPETTGDQSLPQAEETSVSEALQTSEVSATTAGEETVDEPTSEESEIDTKGEDVLAGIEAFRAQLAEMQQGRATDSDEAPTVAAEEAAK